MSFFWIELQTMHLTCWTSPSTPCNTFQPKETTSPKYLGIFTMQHCNFSSISILVGFEYLERFTISQIIESKIRGIPTLNLIYACVQSLIHEWYLAFLSIPTQHWFALAHEFCLMWVMHLLFGSRFFWSCVFLK